MTVLRKSQVFFNLFPIPEFLLLSNSGVAVSDDSIRFVQFKKGIQGTELALVHCSGHTLPAGVVRSGEIADKQALTVALKELGKNYKLEYTRVTLPEERAYLFTTTIEKVPLDDLHDAVAFIIEENVPVSLAESLFDIEIISTKNEDEIKVAVTVVPKVVAEDYTSAFKEAGITPVSFDIESQAIARAIIPRGDTRAHLIVNLSDTKTGLYVVEDEVVQFTSTTPYGSRGEAGPYPDITDLRSELRKLVVFWNTRQVKGEATDRKIEKIIVCGPGGAKLDFLKELFSEVELNWSQADVWTNAFSPRHRPVEMPFDESLGYSASIGLAIPFKERIYV